MLAKTERINGEYSNTIRTRIVFLIQGDCVCWWCFFFSASSAGQEPEAEREQMRRVEDFDFRVGDTVQITNRSKLKKYIGRVGTLIGVTYSDDNGGHLIYRVKFSDSEAGSFPAYALNCVRSNRSSRKGVPYETR